MTFTGSVWPVSTHVHVAETQINLLPQFFYFTILNWLMKSLNQLFFSSLWNVHVFELKLYFTVVNDPNMLFQLCK